MFTIASLPAPAAPLPTTPPPLSRSSPQDPACLYDRAQNLPEATAPPTKRCSTIGALRRNGKNIRKRENAIRAIVEHNGLRLEKLGKDRYQLIIERLNAVRCLFDGVPLKAVEWHFEEARAE